MKIYDCEDLLKELLTENKNNCIIRPRLSSKRFVSQCILSIGMDAGRFKLS
jgi:hypothetical protein